MFDAPTISNGGVIFLFFVVLIVLVLLGSLIGKYLKGLSGPNDPEVGS